ARAVTLAAGCKARLSARPAAPGHWNDVEVACAGVASAVVSLLLQCAKMRIRRQRRHFLAAGVADAKLPVCSTSWHCCRDGGDYMFLNDSKVPGPRFVARAHCPWRRPPGVSTRARRRA